MQAEVEINKKKEEVKSNMTDELRQTSAEQKVLQSNMGANANLIQQRQKDILQNYKKDLENSSKDE